MKNQKKTLTPVSPPSKRERFTLRVMILLGVCSMIYFLFCLFNSAQIGYAPFYWVLMAGITFNCLRLLHEWYHYFDITIPVTPEQGHPFTVDILTTFCPGEPYEMIVETLTAIQAIHYPHTTYLCDEANDPYLAEVCKKLGVRHITRTNRIDAKAGNINNALQFATGELCVIMDPDHVPSPDLLDPIIPHFNDPAVGFVQIVQAYSNLDDSLVAKGAAQQTFQFYGPIMATMNSYGTVLAIGANCTFRRAALDSIGGHASGLSEDMHTAMQLHAKGWKSVYVPVVLTRGLVPATLSAYYSQQLKWARGTFELLVTSYPKLFRHFTWRQRIHYGTIPFHYFSGVIFFINFLIPVLALLTGLIPFRLDMVNFALLAFPLLASLALIRHYVQRWVMEEEERGFHVVGGLLFIGTWWIFMLGLVYTIIRKKVPYIPTPKDDSQPDSWKLYVPNAVVLLTSLAAMAYGLWYDWNPYSIVMSVIAGVNCLIMAFNLVAGMRHRRASERSGLVSKLLVYPILFKKQLWIFRHLHLYAGFRKLGLPLLLISMFVTWYLTANEMEPAIPKLRQPGKESVFYTGIYQPGAKDGITDVVPSTTHFNIISLYIPWGESPGCLLPDSALQAIYNNGSLPMITWEPWTNLFNNVPQQNVFAQISSGTFDRYLERFAGQVKALDRPLYLRFAHEADNPAYPWSQAGGNTPEAFRAAWKYVHRFFNDHGANNVIWVWNPWKPDAVKDYFPGEAYVDWIGVTILNYGAQHTDGRSYSFKELYAPFHSLPEFRTGLPVMVAETGSLADAQQWMNDAFNTIREAYKEIHAVVLFNDPHDRNILHPVEGNALNWSVPHPLDLLDSLQQPHSNRSLFSSINTTNHFTAVLRKVPDTLRGLNYHKGENWFRNLHTLTRREIAKDFREMKALGVNAIRRYGPGVYDRNIMAEAEAAAINIHYGFWVPATTDVQELAAIEKQILRQVKKLKDERCITVWSIGNTGWQQLSELYYKPDLFYQQKIYLSWLHTLIVKIKEEDPLRPVTVDVHLVDNIAGVLMQLRRELPAADEFGIVIEKDTNGLARLAGVDVPHFISQMPVASYVQQQRKASAFITTWQDLESRDFLTFEGLTDHLGRYKPSYYQLAAYWGNKIPVPRLPEIRILRPARGTFPGDKLTYHALVRGKDGWKLAGNGQYEWYLVKTDAYGNDIYMKSLGVGTSTAISIPDRPQYYRLYLEAVKGNDVTGVQTILNTPFR